MTARVEELLAQLTLAEKVAQLGSFWGQPGTGGDVAPMANDFATSAVPFDTAIEHGLGQLTRTWGTAPLSVAEGLATMRERQQRVVAASRFGIPAVAHEECLTGFTAYGATVYPTSLAWGATFDPALVREMARAIGRDMASLASTRRCRRSWTWCTTTAGDASRRRSARIPTWWAPSARPTSRGWRRPASSRP